MPNLQPKDVYGTSGGSPTVESQGVSSARQDITATPGMFGAQVGEAVSSAGKQISETANHFQQIYADSTARDAVTSATQKLSNLEEQYKTNRGNNAVQALPVFQKQAADLINESADGMSPAVSKLFKDQFSPHINGAIFRAGSYAGSQAEHAQITSLDASIANSVNLMALHPDDPISRKTNITNIMDSSFQRAHAEGAPPEVANQLFSHNVGEAYVASIQSLAMTNPDAAKQLYEEAKNGKVILNQNGQNVDVPYLDANHAMQATKIMDTEFKRQESEFLQAARANASSGFDYNRNAVISSMKNSGRSQEYINAEINHLDTVRDEYGAANKRYTLDKDLSNDTQRAMDGFSVQGNYDSSYVHSAFPKNPEKAEDLLSQVELLKQAQGITSKFSTMTPDQIDEQVTALQPKQNKGMISDNAINYVIDKFEGTALVSDGNGQAKFGINSAANPDIDVPNLTREQATQTYKDKYWNAIGADNLPENMKLMAFDTAVNFGVGRAKEMLQQAGNDPAKLAQLRKQAHQDLITNNPEKYGANAAGWQQRDNAIINGMPNENFKEQSKIYNLLQKSATNYINNLYEDPAGTLVKNDENLNGLLQTVNKDPNQINNFIQASLMRQDNAGVPEYLQSALPKSVAGKMTNSIIGNPENAPTQLNKLAELSGNNWPSLYQSLVTQGGLPTYYQSVAQLGGSEDPEVRRDGGLLARWGGEDTKGKTADEIIGTKNVSDIKKAVQGNPTVQAFTQSLGMSNASLSQIAEVKNSIEQLAMAKSFYQKGIYATPSDAAQAAIKSFTNRYEFMPNGGARVPTDKFANVMQSANEVLNNLSNIAAPPDIYNTGFHGLPKAEEYFNAVKGAPTWVTSKNEDAIVLKNSMGKIVLDKEGKPISVPFTIKPVAGAKNNITPSNIPSDSTVGIAFPGGV